MVYGWLNVYVSMQLLFFGESVMINVSELFGVFGDLKSLHKPAFHMHLS